MFKLALYFKQAGTILPFLDVPLKTPVAASTQRGPGSRGERRKEEGGTGGRWAAGGWLESHCHLVSARAATALDVHTQKHMIIIVFVLFYHVLFGVSAAGQDRYHH